MHDVAGTGHRPTKLFDKNPYSEENFRILVEFLKVELERLGVQSAISGMALGLDQGLAQACYELGIPFVAAIPFYGQDRRWPQASKDTYKSLLSKADDVVVVSDGGYAPWKMQIRNEWMVDNGRRVLALWNGSSGGTANCVAYAAKQNKPMINLWERWHDSCLEEES